MIPGNSGELFRVAPSTSVRAQDGEPHSPLNVELRDHLPRTPQWHVEPSVPEPQLPVHRPEGVQLGGVGVVDVPPPPPPSNRVRRSCRSPAPGLSPGVLAVPREFDPRSVSSRPLNPSGPRVSGNHRPALPPDSPERSRTLEAGRPGAVRDARGAQLLLVGRRGALLEGGSVGAAAILPPVGAVKNRSPASYSTAKGSNRTSFTAARWRNKATGRAHPPRRPDRGGGPTGQVLVYHGGTAALSGN
jgi:hypothetical protein